MDRQLGLTIRTRFDGAPTQKGLNDQLKLVRSNQMAVTQLGKVHAKVLKDAQKDIKQTVDTMRTVEGAFDRIGRSAKAAGGHMVSSFRSVVGAVDAVNSKISHSVEKMMSLKNLIIGSAIGGLAFEGGKKLFEAGEARRLARARIGREFGGTFGAGGQSQQFLEEQAKAIAKSAGISQEAALQALIPNAEAIQSIQPGMKLANGKTIRNEQQALAVRRENLTRAARLTGRLLALNPDMNPEEAGRILSDAATGPEGDRAFISAFHLSKSFKEQVEKANAKGQLNKVLTPQEMKRFGLRAGQRVGRGTMLEILAEHSGQTEAAAAEERKRASFQLRTVKANIADKTAEEGEKLLAKMGQGGQLNKLISAVPGALDFLGEHKGLIAGVGGAYGALSLAGKVFGKNMPGGAAGELVKEALGVGGAQQALPVFVTNWGDKGGSGPGIVDEIKDKGKMGVGLLGKAKRLGAALLSPAAVGVAAGAAVFLYSKDTAGNKDTEIPSAATDPKMLALIKRGQLEAFKDRKADHIKALEAAGLSHGQAVRLSEHAGEGFDINHRNARGREETIHISLTLDGKVVSEVVTKHQARRAINHTAGGLAPTHRGE